MTTLAPHSRDTRELDFLSRHLALSTAAHERRLARLIAAAQKTCAPLEHPKPRAAVGTAAGAEGASPPR